MRYGEAGQNHLLPFLGAAALFAALTITAHSVVLGLAVLEQQVRAHNLDAVLGDFGQHKVAESMDVTSAHTEHLGDGGAGDVGIEDADLVTVAGKLGGDGAGDE